MNIWFKLILSYFLCSSLWAVTPTDSWYLENKDKKITLNIELFLSSTCPHCHKADAFFNKIAIDTPSITIHRNIINQDKNALLRFNQLLSEQHLDDFAVPSIYFCDSRWVGFASEETTGKDLLRAINYCKQQIEKEGGLKPATINTLRQWANANKFDAGMVEIPSSWSYIATIALTDAVSPCSFFVFAGFLAIIWVSYEKRKQVIAACLFLVSIVLVHYFQQVYTSEFYQILPWLRIPSALIGGLGIYFFITLCKKQPQARLYYMMAFLLGLIIMLYQQTCIMNWSYIFQQWLNNQPFSVNKRSFVQLLYQVLYILPSLLILVSYQMLMKIKRVAAWQPRFFNIGLLFILLISFCLIIYPMVLSSFGISLIAFMLLALCGAFLNLT